MFDLEDLPKKKDPLQGLKKADLERLSLDELAELKAARLADIALIDAEVARKKAQTDAANLFFKKS